MQAVIIMCSALHVRDMAIWQLCTPEGINVHDAELEQGVYVRISSGLCPRSQPRSFGALRLLRGVYVVTEAVSEAEDSSILEERIAGAKAEGECCKVGIFSMHTGGDCESTEDISIEQ